VSAYGAVVAVELVVKEVVVFALAAAVAARVLELVTIFKRPVFQHLYKSL
jgi:hypothetical protein